MIVTGAARNSKPMKILVTDRESIEQGFLIRSSYALISIRDSDASSARVPKSTALRGVLHLAFDDAEPSQTMPLPPEITVMTPAQARQIWRFVGRYQREVGAFVVHCHQGMSRSPAVAAALAIYLGQSDKPFWRDYSPNLHVYRLLRHTMPEANQHPSKGKERHAKRKA